MDIMDVMKWDAALKVGDHVKVRWTNSHNYYAQPGVVVKLNRESVRVALDNDVTAGGQLLYPKGREIRVPRCTFNSIKLWSVNNGVFPL